MSPRQFVLLILILTFNTTFVAQFKINHLSSGFDNLNEPLFLGITETRNIENLNQNWNIFFADDPSNISEISFPAIFTSTQEIILEKKFTIAGRKALKNFVTLNFLGINYSAEIFVNNTGIYKHPGGEIPFSIDLPNEILNFDSPNILRIKIQYRIDSENTIPLLQRFLFPKNEGGILRDVFLSFRPKVGIKRLEYSLVDDSRPYEGRLNFNVLLENFIKIVRDSLLNNFDGRFKIEALLTKTSDTSKVYYNIWNINPLKVDEFSKDFYVRLREISRWNIDLPISYIISIRLTNGEGFIFDELIETISLLNIIKNDKRINVNKNDFSIKGITYIRSIDHNLTYKQLEDDILQIKETGFNTIRFSKTFPHPYSVYLCHKLGLFALLELPLNSVPESYTEDSNFEDRAKSFLERTIKFYDRYPTVIAYGTGGSFLGNSQNHLNFISKLNKFIKSTSNGRLSYASIIGFNYHSSPDTDLLGIELFAKYPPIFERGTTANNQADSIVYFVSEATYPSYAGATNGYLNEFSFEGQAKYFDDIIVNTNNNRLSGFVLNSMYDYSGDYTPFFSGFNEKNVYKIGIFPRDGNETRISYNLVKTRLKSGKTISIPIGSNEEDAPLFFIIAALAISVIIALLINSKRKFREDATRALLRPYNFFADIRDQRIMSGFHSNILMFLLAGSNALLITILLFYLRNNILLEKIIISFGNYEYSSIIGFLAWHPQKAFLYIYIATIFLFISISFLVHLSSFFVKTKVLYSSVYSVLIWSLLPLALLIPLQAVLYKILLINSYNHLIFGFLFIFIVWNIQRFFKGIYVIFDVRPLFVYSYAFLFILVVLVGVGIYFQYSVNAYDFIYLSIKQYINM